MTIIDEMQSMQWMRDRVHELEAENAHLKVNNEALRSVLQEVSDIINKSEHWWVDIPDRGGFDTDKIDEVLKT